jgi:hypothetical protein
MPAPIRIPSFRGERPGTGSRLLPEGYAQSARNCRLIDGQIDPIGDQTDVETITQVLDHRAITSDGYESTWQYVQNRRFSREKLFWTEGDGWNIAGGKAVRTAVSASSAISQSLDREDAMPRIKAGLSYTVEFTVSGYVAGTLTPKLGGTSGSSVSASGDFSQNITAGSTNKLLEFEANAAGDYKVDDVSVTVNLGTFGAAAGGNDAWIRLEWSASDVAGEYDGWTVKTVGGTGSGQTKTISEYLGDQSGLFHIARVTTDWGTVPDSTTVYELYRPVSDGEVKTIYLFNRGGEFDFTADADTDVLTAVDHKLKNGDTLTTFSSGTLPGGISTGQQLFVIDRTPDTFKIAATLSGSAIDITSAGSGTHTARKGMWFRWGTEVHAAGSPVAGDKSEMTIWTGQGAPKISFKGHADADDGGYSTTGWPKQYYTLGVPEPRIDDDDDVEAGGGEGDDFYLTYQNDANDTDLHSDLLAVGWDGATYKNFIVEVQSGVRLGASASGKGLFIQAAWPVGTTIAITNGGTVNGGHGAGGAANGGNGGDGGDAIDINSSFNVKVGDVTTDFATDDKIDLASHGFTNGMAVNFSSAGTLPAGLSADTIYYVINKTDNDFEVSTTRGGSAVDITDDGTGTHSVFGVYLSLTNSSGATIAGGGGGGGGGGLGRGCNTTLDGKVCTSSCCSSNGGAGGKGRGNTAAASGSSADAACGGTNQCSGTCTPASHQGGAGGAGGAYATVGTAGSNATGQATGCASGTTTGGSAGAKGIAIEGVSKINVLTNNGTITGDQDN